MSYAFEGIDWLKFLKALLILTLATALQFVVGEFVSVWMNFVLAALMALAFFLDLSELIFFVSLGVFILNWQPAVSREAVVLAALPFIVRWFHGLFPWQVWLSSLTAVAAGLLLLYLIADFGFILRVPSLFLLDLMVSLGFSSLIVSIMGARR